MKNMTQTLMANNRQIMGGRMIIFKTIAFLSLLTMLAGCSTTGVIYSVAADERAATSIVSDNVIVASLKKTLIEDGGLKALNISVYCYNGHVFLIGESDTEGQKEKAVKTAKGIAGVKSVETYILPQKKHDTCGMADNLAMQAELEADFLADLGIWSSSIDIKVVQCQIILLGIAESRDEINKAIAQAKSVEGNRGVRSYIKLK
jgi:hyperosmotically inducible protein